ncbi:hypothetical protein [Bacillus sp. AK128]
MTQEMILCTNDDHQRIMLNIQGLYQFQGYQVVEAFTVQKDECYYLFFYKNKFLTGKKTIKLKRTSTLANVLTKGIYLSSPHPIIQSLVSSHSHYSLPKINKTWKSIKKEYDPIEAAHILTIFDSYLKKETVISSLKEICLQFRRDGKFLMAFRLLQLILQKYPKNEWAQSLISHLDYQKYTFRYQSELVTLLQFDSLYVENQLYLKLDEVKSFNLLQAQLRKYSRHLESLTLYNHRLTHYTENFEEQLSDLLKYSLERPNIDLSSYLFSIYNQTKRTENKEKLQHFLLSQLINHNQYEDAFQLLTDYKNPFSETQLEFLITIVENLDSTYILPFDQFSSQNLVDANTKQLDLLLQALLPRLFKQHDINFVYQWLQPLFHIPLHMISKIKKMYSIKEDPEQQHVMGELYYEIHQIPQAIECFLWDVELNPTNPHSISWLTKLYHELGMFDESKSYQYLYKQIQKSS